MQEETKTRTVVEVVYIAEDGTEFRDKQRCLRYEWEQTATIVYTVIEGGVRNLLYQDVCLFSSVDKAKAYIKKCANSDQLLISPIFLDEEDLR